jgi:hypothetical protein
MLTARTLAIVCPIAIAPGAFAQWSIDASSIACGGGVTSGGPYSMRATIGAVDAAPQLGSLTFTIMPGFWPAASVRANPCPGDHNADNAVDGDDIIAFFSDWDRGELTADKNRDGGVDGDDVILFFARWDGGC